MNNRAWVLASLNHERVDRIPLDIFEGWMWPDITSRIMRRLRARDYEDLLEKMGACCRWVTPMYVGPPLPPGAKDRVASPHTTHSLNAAIWGLHPGLKQHGLNTGGHPLAGAQSCKQVLEHSWPSPEWFDYDGLNQSAKKHRDHFVIAGGFSPIFYLISDLCGMEKALMDMIVNPELIEALVDRIVAFYRGYYDGIAKTCKGNVDAIAFGDDFAGQMSMLMSPEMWRKYLKPAWAELFSIARENGFKVVFHSCGSVSQVIPDLIEIGVDVLYPVQPGAESMDMVTLKDSFGNALSFYGGIDVQRLLPFARAGEIRAEVERLRRLFQGSGGYIMSTSHVIMDQVPEENVLAVYGQARSG
jgi:uroporphyrinogen decarboxylase